MKDSHPTPSLPQVEKIELTTPAIKQLGHEPSLQQVLESEEGITNMQLEGLCQSWKLVRNVDDACKLSRTTMRILKERRDLLRMEYGVGEVAAHKGGVVYPVD